MSFEVVKPGLLTTVQDLGRFGHRQEGVVVSGAMDAVAHRTANLLVGNPEQAAALEFTMLGPTLRFEANHLIALTGASFSPRINGQKVASGRCLFVKKGATLEVGAARAGCCGYLAVAGGIEVPAVMGSASTYLRAGLGGLNGRALQQNNLVPCADPPAGSFPFPGLMEMAANGVGYGQAAWYPAPDLFPPYRKEPVIRVMKGPEYKWFSPKSQVAFWEQPFTVSVQSDRMGARLTGPTLSLAEPRELLSTAVTLGTVQVPAQGNPIVLLADHQTTGGYPRIAQVISADFSALAQTAPRQQLRFQEVSLEEAQKLYLQQEQNLEKLKSAICLKRHKM